MGQPHGLQGQRDGWVGSHRRGGWGQEARSELGGVPRDRSNLSPVTPSPAGAAAATLPACPSLQPPSTHGCCGHPRHSRGAWGAHATKPPDCLASPLRAGSHHKPRCFLKVSFLAAHYANPPTPKKSFLSVFPCASVTVLRRAISAGRGNVINRPETFSLGGTGQCNEDRNQSFAASAGE